MIKPVDPYIFNAKHDTKNRGMKKIIDYGCNFICTKRADYVLGWFVV